MLDPSKYLEVLTDSGIEFFSGVPDSLLKDFCSCISNSIKPSNHIITANEGAAIGLAIGNHIGTNKLPLVYMQNSGLGNCINPILSLANTDIYSVPILLFIGWRGEPGQKDEPQHIVQGNVTLDLLNIRKIPNIVLSDEFTDAKFQTLEIIKKAFKINSPVALIVKKNLFSKSF